MTGIHQLLFTNFAAGGGGVTQILAFTGTGSWTCPTGVTEIDYLIVAGGGSGGDGRGGGGGAGGFRTGTGYTVTAGETYTITVGAGGTVEDVGAGGAVGGDGGDSEIAKTGFVNVTSTGGGGGGAYNQRAGRDGS